jgi:hypothetical protein
MKSDIWIFSKICRENSSFIKIWQELRVLYMKTNIHFLSHLAQLFLEWEIFKTKVIEEIRRHILCSMTSFSRKSCRLWDNVEKYCRAGQATGDNMAHAYCKATNTHSEYVILLIFHCNNDCTNAPQRYVIRTLPGLFFHLCTRQIGALRYKPAGRGFDSRWCHWNFSVS